MAEDYHDSYETEYTEPQAEVKEPAEHAAAHWRESFDQMEKPKDGHWSDDAIDGFTTGFKTGTQMYALTFDPSGTASFAASMAAEVLSYTVDKSADAIKQMRDSDDPADDIIRKADLGLTKAIQSRDPAGIRAALDLAQTPGIGD